jgi:hypothetical protein
MEEIHTMSPPGIWYMMSIYGVNWCMIYIYAGFVYRVSMDGISIARQWANLVGNLQALHLLRKSLW